MPSCVVTARPLLPIPVVGARYFLSYRSVPTCSQCPALTLGRVHPYVAPRMSRPEASAARIRLDLLDPADVARLGGLELVSEGIVEGFLAGLHRSPRRGFSVEFAEHRMYQPGDEAALCRLEDARPERPPLCEAVRGGDQPPRHDRLRCQPVDGLVGKSWRRALQVRLRAAPHRGTLPDPRAPARCHRAHRL